MRHSDVLRDRAARLRQLAIKAREDGKPLLAQELTKIVIELSEEADDVDRRDSRSEGE
jgi:hypothetical protein